MINKELSEILFKIKNKSDLNVILNTNTNTSALTESYLTKVPTISLNCDLDISEIKSSYKITGNFQFQKKKIRDFFFYSILTAVIKKANRNLKSQLKKK